MIEKISGVGADLPDNAFTLNKVSIFERLSKSFMAVHDALKGKPGLLKHQRLPKTAGRIANDEFFQYTTSFKAEYQLVNKGYSDVAKIDLEKKQFFFKTLETEMNFRYNNSRRNALMSAANQAKRISIDLPEMF